MATEKELKVLNKIFELGGKNGSVHYLKLVEIIFDKEIIDKYKGSKIKNMVCGYLGKMARKDYIQAAYERTDAGYTFFIG